MTSDRSHLRTIIGGIVVFVALKRVAAWPRTSLARRVRRAFTAWAKGVGSIYDLMESGSEIIITGTAAHSGSYRKDAFLSEVAKPFVARFNDPPLPRLVALWSEGSTVVVRAEAGGTTRDGADYANAYVFIFDFINGRLARVTEFLDMAAFEAVWDRVEPALHAG